MSEPVSNLYPVLLDNPRAWRTYLGGSQIDLLHGKPGGEDGHFPEEWILSVVNARNAGREHITDEGMSRLAETGGTLKELLESDPAYYLGEAHAARCGATPGVLLKLIDSAERLTLQVHPDREQAMKLFNSPYGKTECWYILGGHPVDGEEPCIYLGFQPWVTREKWEKLFREQDIPGMLEAMQKYPVQPGQTILIEGGMPHAIGAGCFLAEIQEPTDFTIRVERTTPAGFAVADSMCHQGLGFERMFDAFHYEPLSRSYIQNRWFITPETLQQSGAGSITTRIGYGTTPLFRLDEVVTDSTLTVPNPAGCYSGLYVLEGSGTVTANGRTLPVNKTNQFFLPAQVGDFTLQAETPLRVLHFFGPRAEN